MAVIINGVTTHEGKVVQLIEHNGYHDSDFCAVVWDDETSTLIEVEYATTRFAGGGNAVIDATPEVLEKVEAHLARYEQAKRDALARVVDVGKKVRFARGRKVAIGTEGEVFWIGANQFRTYYRNGYNKPTDAHNKRAGVRLADGTQVFTAFTNLEVVIDQEAISA